MTEKVIRIEMLNSRDNFRRKMVIILVDSKSLHMPGIDVKQTYTLEISYLG